MEVGGEGGEVVVEDNLLHNLEVTELLLQLNYFKISSFSYSIHDIRDATRVCSLIFQSLQELLVFDFREFLYFSCSQSTDVSIQILSWLLARREPQPSTCFCLLLIPFSLQQLGWRRRRRGVWDAWGRVVGAEMLALHLNFT